MTTPVKDGTIKCGGAVLQGTLSSAPGRKLLGLVAYLTNHSRQQNEQRLILRWESGFLLAGRHRFLLPWTKENGGAVPRAMGMAHITRTWIGAKVMLI